MAQETVPVLLVDDDPERIRLVSDTLAAAAPEFELACVPELATALERVAAEPPALVLFHLGLAQSGGAEGVAALLAARDDVPVVVLSEHEDDADGAAAVEQGAQLHLAHCDLVPRPFASSLRQAIDRHVLARRASRAVRQFRASERFLQTSLDALPQCIAILDDRGRVRAVNAAWREFETASPLLGAPALDRCEYMELCERAPASRAPTARVLGRAIRDVMTGARESYDHEFCIHIGDEEHWFSIRVTRFRWNGPPRVAISHSDITTRKRTENALHAAREQALAASRAKSDFLANMSHEIRTPMNAIIGMTSIVLDEGELDSPERQYLEIVHSSAQALLLVLNDILDFSKIEARKLELERIRFSLRATLNDTLKALALRAHEKGLEYASQVAQTIPDNLVGDPGRLRQVLMNLISNAVKFTDEGEIVVRVREEAQADDSAVLHFEVSDTGIGISQDKQALIFEAFAQADGSITRRYGGTGLGLTISSLLVELMGGRIWVESEVGRGSTFHFTAKFGVRASTSAARGLVPEEFELAGTRVLVADDNSTSRRILSETLEEWGMRAVCVDSGAAALDEIAAAHEAGKRFELALIDVQMPRMDGFELAEKIREDNRNADTELILMTMSGQRGDAARCRALAINGYLTKPISQNELYEAIRIVLAGPPDSITLQLVTKHTVRELRARLSILLAEDNEANRKLATHLLTKRGHRVTAVDDGQKAVDAWEAGEFDLILMDVQMPHLDGMEAAAMIREREAAAGSPRIPIIALTAYAMSGDRERCMAAGMDGYVSKPIDSQKLFEAIEQFSHPPTSASQPLIHDS
jgi:CheY-like chemotaxis protein/nitrogen-specific signal transduction histidine kinase